MARILIVDDQPMNRELIHAYLEGSDHILADAASGDQALALAEKEPPDLVLLDVMLPGLSGFETTRRLKEHAGGLFLPVILLTSLSDRSSRLHGLEIGADDFLTKPVDRQELSARIRNLLALREKDLALIEKNVALAELNRFKEEMFQLVVHDLKTPMSVIVSNHEYLTEGLRGADPSYHEALTDSQTAGRRILRLLANLLDVARLEASRLDLRRAPTSVGALLDDIAQQRRLVAQARRIAINVTASAQLEIQADADLLTRAVENILDNSLRYTQPEGRIEMSAEAADGSAQIRIGNTGPAIPMDARTIIFEKFGQATPRAGRMNLGLGLYFCRLAAEAHGGRIWVEETAALPTLFVLQLPL